jgi:membrane associated rhomboid family serine protease
MATCDRCGAQESMPYQCRMCGGTYCAEHRLPENHDCPGQENWNDPGGVFDSGFDATVEESESSVRGRLAAALPSTRGLVGYLSGNVTYLILALMWFTFVAELLVLEFAASPWATFETVFVLRSSHLAYVWTWVTSVFSHNPGGFFHIFVNSLVLYFFGPVVERRVGTRKFAALFLASGVVAGLAQVTTAAAMGTASGVLGASGAIAAVLGVLTVLNPNLRIYLWFVIPMPLWVATALFAGYSILVSSVGGIGAGGVAQVAHLSGLGVGLAYGYYLKRQGERVPRQIRFGGGGPGGPGGPGRGPF